MVDVLVNIKSLGEKIFTALEIAVRPENDSFDFDLAKEIAEEKNKDSQFLKYFYYVAWNTIRYGGDIYQNLRNFSRLLFFESVI